MSNVLKERGGPARPPVRGRGSQANPGNRFERLAVERDPDAPPEAPATEADVDAARSILVDEASPNVRLERRLDSHRGP